MRGKNTEKQSSGPPTPCWYLQLQEANDEGAAGAGALALVVTCLTATLLGNGLYLGPWCFDMLCYMCLNGAQMGKYNAELLGNLSKISNAYFPL